jgi:signal transduction histidine kinase
MGMEAAILTTNNETGLILLSGILLMFVMGITLLAFFYFSKKKIIQKELEKKNIELQHSKELLEATLEVQEKERKRIAQDLHDDISSTLNVVSLNCHMLKLENLEKDKETEIVNTVIELSSKVLENSRRIAHNLFPPVFDKFGLNAGIEELCREFNSIGNVTVSYKSNIEFGNAERERHMHVFRILQELINNSIKHGKATGIDILFDTVDGKTTCIYNDNGKGFDPESLENKKGLGMKNIRSRINFIKGNMSINSKLNRGTNITFSF